MPRYCAGLCPFSHQQGRYIRGARTVAVLCPRRPSRLAADLLWLPNAAKRGTPLFYRFATPENLLLNRRSAPQTLV